MNPAILANITAITHITTIVAVIAGLLVSFRYKRFRPWEAGILISIVILWSYYGNCPLTIIEQHYREEAGQVSNITDVGFLPYYAHKLFDYELTSRTVQNSTFFTGGILFTASIEWFAPFMHIEIFRLRKFLRSLFRKSHRPRARRA